MSVVDLSVDVIGDEFCPTPDSSVVGTQRNCQNLRINSN